MTLVRSCIRLGDRRSEDGNKTKCKAKGEEGKTLHIALEFSTTHSH
jgi:hypothetical protein